MREKQNHQEINFQCEFHALSGQIRVGRLAEKTGSKDDNRIVSVR
jgi:hypothetical protein